MKTPWLLIVAVSAFPALAEDVAKPWASSFGAWLALTSGNTDTRNYNLSFTTKYDPKTRIVFKSDALYLRGESNGTKQVDKATGDARVEDNLSDRTFAFGEISYLRDPFKDLNFFIAPLPGVGYRIIKSDTRNLSVDGAVGAETESHATGSRSSSGAVKTGENFDWAISTTSKATQKLTGIWKPRDVGDALYHFDAGLGTTAAARTELKIAYSYDYKTRVVSSAIKKGDSALFAALLFKF